MSDPAFIKQLQDAVDRGQVVLISAPQPPATPLPRDEASLIGTLCILFELTHNEGQILTQLLTHDYRTINDLHDAVTPKLTVGTLRVFLSSLRKKLAHHNIWLTGVSKLGYGLSTEARNKILAHLTQHDAAAAPTLKPAQDGVRQRRSARPPP